VRENPVPPPSLVGLFTHGNNDRIQTDAGIVEKHAAIHFTDCHRSGFTFKTCPEGCIEIHGNTDFSSEIVESPEGKYAKAFSRPHQLAGNRIDGTVAASGDHEARFGPGRLL